MVGHGTVRALGMEGDSDRTKTGGATSGAPAGTVEWIIRLALLALAVAAVWTVFGDDIGQFLGR
jgi:hypothetical protein